MSSINRRNAKRPANRAKENFWCKYGEHLKELCKTCPRDFSNNINSMNVGDESYNQITIINNNNDVPIHSDTDKKGKGGNNSLIIKYTNYTTLTL